MRNLKKVLALVIAFSMMLSVVAFAGFNDVAEDADYAGAVELLSALDIIVGDDLGNFNPDKTISRAEMAAIICRIKGLEASANAAKGATKFVDVPADHWASGYVNIANQNGVIAGYGDGKFGPEDEVTYEAAVKMVVCALGFEPMAAQKGGWPTGYLVVANTYKISEGVAGSTRADVAVLVYNALSTPMMDQTVYGADAEFEILDDADNYRTLLTDMDIHIATGIVMDVEKSEDIAYFVAKEESDYPKFEEDELYEFEINGSNIADYQFQNVDVYVKEVRKDYEVVAIVPGVIGETFGLLSDDVKIGESETVGTEIEYYVDAATSSKTKKIKLDSEDFTVVYNKNPQTGEDAKSVTDIVKEDDVELVFIENSGDTKYDVLIATKYHSAQVKEVNASRDRINIGGTTISFDFDDEDKDIVLCDEAGNALTLEDFAENDVVAVLHDGAKLDKPNGFDKYIKIIKLADSAVTGTVEETYVSNGEMYVVIDGEDYKDGTEELTVGDEGIFYVGMTGKIIVFDGEAAGVNYAYIVEAALSDSSFTADRWQIKLLTKNDGVVTYDVTDEVNKAFTKYALDAEWISEIVDDEDEVIGYTDFLWEENIDTKGDQDRFITFKANAKGQIKSFEAADGDDETIDALGADAEYRAGSQRLDGNTLEDDAAIFVVTADEADDVYVTDISFLVDEDTYEGFVFENAKGDCVAAVITAGDGDFVLENGFAIVTKKSDTKDADDNDIVKLTVAQNEEEVVIVIDDESKAEGVDSDEELEGYQPYDADDIDVGSVILYNADAEGIVSKYAVIATVKNDLPVLLNEDLCVKDADDADIAIAYIDKRDGTKSKGDSLDLVWVDGELEEANVIVGAAANQYTYNSVGRNEVIEIADYLAETVDEKVEGEVSYVIVRTYENDVVDIYSFTKRVELEGK